VFCIASTVLDDAAAERYHAELLQRSNARELKHIRLMRRPFGHAKIANFLRQIIENDLEAFAVWACHKPFALLTYFIDLWCEPLARRDGYDLYKDGAVLAMANMTYCGLPAYTNEAFLTSILSDFQAMMTHRGKRSYDTLLTNLLIKYNSSERSVQEIIIMLLGPVHLLGYEHLRELPGSAMDLAEAGLSRLCHIWRSRSPGPFVLHHDRSTQLARHRAVWEFLLSKDMPSREFGTGDRRMTFPVNVQRTSFVDSVSEKQVQLCDVVAGAVATWGRGVIRDETSEYLAVLREIDMEALVTEMVWPQLEVDPDKLGTRGMSGDMIDYLTAELEKRRP
jgi:hypothetical protein